MKLSWRPYFKDRITTGDLVAGIEHMTFFRDISDS